MEKATDTAMEERVITVVPQERAVVVDGEGLSLDGTGHGAGLKWSGFFSMSWNPRSGAKTRGFVSMPGDAYGFDDFARIEPYATAWALERQRHADNLRRDHEQQLAADQEKARQRAEHLAAKERQWDAERPLRDALALLNGTDHKMLKALEQVMLASGISDVVPASVRELIDQREAARLVVREHKTKAVERDQTAEAANG